MKPFAINDQSPHGMIKDSFKSSLGNRQIQHAVGFNDTEQVFILDELPDSFFQVMNFRRMQETLDLNGNSPTLLLGANCEFRPEVNKNILTLIRERKRIIGYGPAIRKQRMNDHVVVNIVDWHLSSRFDYTNHPIDDPTDAVLAWYSLVKMIALCRSP
jgi:hypothetical protein